MLTISDAKKNNKIKGNIVRKQDKVEEVKGVNVKNILLPKKCVRMETYILKEVNEKNVEDIIAFVRSNKTIEEVNDEVVKYIVHHELCDGVYISLTDNINKVNGIDVKFIDINKPTIIRLLIGEGNVSVEVENKMELLSIIDANEKNQEEYMIKTTPATKELGFAIGTHMLVNFTEEKNILEDDVIVHLPYIKKEIILQSFTAEKEIFIFINKKELEILEISPKKNK